MSKTHDSRAEDYANLVKHFRIVGKPDFPEVALLSGVTVARAKKAWNEGLGTKGSKIMGPIRDMFLHEKARARATRARLHAKILDKAAADADAASDDSALSAALEGLVARRAMLAADELVGHVHTLAAALRPLVESVAKDLVGIASDPDSSTHQRMAYMSGAVKIFRDAIDVIDKAQKLEGRHLGRPDVRVQVTSGDSGAIDDAIQTIRNVYSIIAKRENLQLPHEEGEVFDAEAIEVS